MSDKKYKETLESLYFVTRQLSKMQRDEEATLAILDSLRSVICDFDTKVIGLHGKQKLEWLERIKTLKQVFEHIGAIYLQELYWRKKVIAEQKTNLELSNRIGELEKQIANLEKMNEL